MPGTRLMAAGGSALLPAGLLLAGALSVAGCGGGSEPARTPAAQPRPAEQHSAAAGLAVHRGKGYTVGYPGDWRPDPEREIFPSAVFEVTAPAAGGPAASLSVFTESETRSIERLLRGFIARSKRSRDFRLLERRELDTGAYGGRDAHVVRKAYTASGRDGPGEPVRQVDLFVRVSRTSIVNVRMLFSAERYDSSQRQISAVLGSFRVPS
ncbi:hypothetical protein [Actinomadura sp. 7K507]|uniref:hypothetical protein n=1 Tax=Actinomadura sp. 7K507 TaxID=2530365 RepID=UPI001050E7F1|nr:hypothetical protein [Actinomadura sp. 7K507]TDC77590.1 hypothetical protein E1285_38525 [Actinomadura sp. 7K507]